jgi:hypothetical protein
MLEVRALTEKYRAWAAEVEAEAWSKRSPRRVAT